MMIFPDNRQEFEPSAFVPAARHTDDVNSRENMGTTKRMDTVIVKAKQLTCINKNSDIIDVRTIPQSLSCTSVNSFYHSKRSPIAIMYYGAKIKP
jgi:hypothetical protein